MSRIGNRVLSIPAGVTVTVDGTKVAVKGPKGELTNEFSNKVNFAVEDGKLTITRIDDTKENKSLHGTTNALVANMIKGVSEGFEEGLEAIGVGYRFTVAGNKLTINAGYSHPVVIEAPKGISIEGISNTEIKVSGIDKQQVSEFAANIRKVREPEPYKGKGIRYKGEYVRRKEGKKAAK